MNISFRRCAVVAGMLVLGAGAVTAQTATPTQSGVVRAGAPAKPGPVEFFTGKVMVAELVKPVPPGQASTGLVKFQPGARSNWHRHPAGQTLYVTDGCGWTQRQGGAVERICKGDTVYVPAGVRHWHGATATTAMTHLSISETLGGGNVTWMEPVSDAQFHGPER